MTFIIIVHFFVQVVQRKSVFIPGLHNSGEHAQVKNEIEIKPELIDKGFLDYFDIKTNS